LLQDYDQSFQKIQLKWS